MIYLRRGGGEGRVVTGVNVENAAYPLGVCAERTALACAATEGVRPGDIEAMAITASPCGGCRQRIAEFGTPETLVYLCDDEGVKETVRLGDLLPKAFGQEAL